jgi:hypothetical protein
MYYVTVSDENQCTSRDTVIVTLNVMDLELEQLLEPSTSCELSESITVKARIKNAGNQAIPSGQTINMGYRIDGGSIVQDSELLSANLLPGHTLDFTFSNSESVQTGQWYDFTVFVDYENDSRRWNDTVITSVGVFATPQLDLGEEYQSVQGFEYILDAGEGFASYEWQDGSTNRTFTVTAPGINLYSVTVTNENGCTAYDEVQVFLSAPDVGIKEILHPVTACRLEESEQIQVAVQNYGNYDIEPSALINVSYSINGANEVSEPLLLADTFENGTVILHTFSQAEDFSEPGNYDILVAVSYDSDLIPSNDLALVTVEHYGSPLTDIGQGKDTVLVYEPITLSATPGYPSYEWQDGSTGTDYHIPDPSAGWYKVVVTGENGCATHDSVYAVYDRPDLGIVRLAAPVSSCAQDGYNEVSVEIVNNGYYRISPEDTIILTYTLIGKFHSAIEEFHLENELPMGESVVLTFEEGYDFSTPDNYQIQSSLIYTPDQDSENDILESGITVWDSPEVDIGGGQDTIITGLPYTMDAGTGYASYLWQDNSSGSAFQATVYGTYWVTVTDEHGCPATDSVVIVSQTSAGDYLVSGGQVRIYPNPVKDLLHVAFDLRVEKQVVLELYSITNALVYREDIKRAQVTEARIDVQDMTPGTYYLRITADDVPHNFLVIIE